jgi:hypothetical protein
MAYFQARNAWAQHGLAIVGFVTGAAAPMPQTYKGRWIFGPNEEAKNVFYNGALQHSVQQLYMSTGISCVLFSNFQNRLLNLIPCSQVYLGDVVAGTLPPPPLLLPPITFPRYVSQGLPKTQEIPSTLATIPKALHSNIAPATALPTGQEEDDISLEQDQFKQRLLQVTPGSSEAESLMDILEETARKISHPKTKTTASLLGIFAKALWKDRQGMFQGLFCDLL